MNLELKIRWLSGTPVRHILSCLQDQQVQKSGGWMPDIADDTPQVSTQPEQAGQAPQIEPQELGDIDEAGMTFFDPEKQSWSPKKDFELCLDLNRFDFVLKVERENELNYLRKINI